MIFLSSMPSATTWLAAAAGASSSSATESKSKWPKSIPSNARSISVSPGPSPGVQPLLRQKQGALQKDPMAANPAEGDSGRSRAGAVGGPKAEHGTSRGSQAEETAHTGKTFQD